MLSTAELLCLRESLALLFDQTVDVLRKTRTNTADGPVVTTVVVLNDEPARVDAITEQEQVIAQRLSAVEILAFTFAATADVRMDDQILWSGKTYEVKAIPYQSVDIGQRALAVRVS